MNSSTLLHIPDCTDRCMSTQHGDIITAAITKRQVSDLDLCCYLNYICCNCENVVDSMGRTALHMAASCGRTKLARWLIQSRHANINAKDRESGYTPLHRSLFYGKIEMAIELIKLGASLSILDLNDLTAPEHAMKDGLKPVEKEGEVYIWGCNASHSLGMRQFCTVPELLDEFHKQCPKESVKQMCTDKFHSVIVTSSGQVYSCGHAQGGRLGLGNEISCVVPKLVTFPDPNCVIIKTSISRDHSLFLSEDNSVYSCGLNTFHVLGFWPSPPFLLVPNQIKCFYREIKGICTGQYHSVVWSAKFLYTWGLNGGQLGHSFCDKFIFTPKVVNSLNFEDNSITDVCASDGATAVYTKKGDIYVFHEYKCRKIASRQLGILQISLVGGKLNASLDQALQSKNEQLKIVVLTDLGNLLLWQENDPQLLRCIFSINCGIIVKQVKINSKQLLFVSKDGTVFQGIIKERMNKTITQKQKNEKSQFYKFLEQNDCIYVKITKIEKIHRAFYVHSDQKGNDYCVIQTFPYRHFQFPEIMPSEFKQDFFNLLQNCSENDNLHDIVFKVAQTYFPAHRFIVATKSDYLEKLLNCNDRIVEIHECLPEIFQQFLQFCYTNSCDFLNCCDDKEIRSKVKKLQHLAQKISCFELQAILEKYMKKCEFIMDELKFDRLSLTNFYDLTIKCMNGKEIMAHKCILVARMEYFNNMFSTRWQNVEKSSVNMPYARNIVEILLEYLYTDNLSTLETKDIDHLLKVLILADELFVSRLKEQCEFVLTNLLTIKNCEQLLQFSHIYNATKLKYCCLKFITDNLCPLLESKSLDEVNEDLLKELSDFYFKEKREISCRVVTPFSVAPTDEEIQSVTNAFPVSLDEEIEKNKKQRRRSKLHKTERNVCKNEESKENFVVGPPPNANCSQSDNENSLNPVLNRLRVIKMSEEIEDLQSDFVKLSPKSFDDFPLLNSPPNSYSKSPKFEFAKHKMVKISQKQRKRLSNSESSTSESPKNPWKITEIVCGSPDSESLNEIILGERKQKENLNKIKSKLLIYTQIEDKAIDELNKFYNVNNVTDEIITVNRVDIGAVALPVWVSPKR